MAATSPRKIRPLEPPRGGAQEHLTSITAHGTSTIRTKNRGLVNASSYLGDARLAAAKDGGIVGPSEQTLKTEANRFATTIRDVGPQDAQSMLDDLGQRTTGGDSREIANEANNALREAGLGDRYLVSGFSDGGLRLTRTEAVPNSLRQEAKLSFYTPGEAPNAPNRTPSADKLGEEARRFAEEVGQSGNPEQSLRDCLDELKKMGADSSDVARPLNLALKQSGLTMSVSANSAGEVVLNSYRTKSEVIAETKVASATAQEVSSTENEASSNSGAVASVPGETAPKPGEVPSAPGETAFAPGEAASAPGAAASVPGETASAPGEVASASIEVAQRSMESTTSGDPDPVSSSEQGDDKAVSSESIGEDGFAPHLIHTGIIKDKVMSALRRLGSGPARAKFLAVNGIPPDSARVRSTGEKSEQQEAEQPINHGSPKKNQVEPIDRTQRVENAGQANQKTVQAADNTEYAVQQAQTSDQLNENGRAGDQQQAQTADATDVRADHRTFEKDGATISVSKINGREVTTAVVRPDGSKTVYGNHDEEGNPGSIEEYNPEAQEPFRTATRGADEVWTTIQGGKEFKKQGHLTVDNGTHRFQTADGTTFVRMPDGKASLEVAPTPDRVEEREGSKIEFRRVNGKEVTSAITYPNGFKAVYGGHDADGNPTSIKEYAKDSKQPFRTAKLAGDTWKIESPGRQPLELKGTLTVKDGVQTFDTVEAKFMRTASGSEKIEAKNRT